MGDGGAKVNWTKEKPTQFGFYWFQPLSERQDIPPSIVSVFEWPDIGDELTFVYTGSGITFEVEREGNGLWYGPLTPPDNREI